MDVTEFDATVSKIASRLVGRDAERLQAMFYKNAPRYKAAIDLVRSYLGEQVGCRMLDYGCGYPFVVAILVEMGYDVTGFEPFADDVQFEVAEQLGLRGRFVSLLPPQDEFDVVLLVDVIEHLSVVTPTMQKLLSTLRPGGLLAITTPNAMRFDIWWAFFRRKTAHPVPLEQYLRSDNNWVLHQREYTLDELKRLVAFYGLTVIEARVADTFAEPSVRAEYRRLLGEPAAPRSIRNLAREVLRRRLPRSWRGCLLLLCRKAERSSS